MNNPKDTDSPVNSESFTYFNAASAGVAQAAAMAVQNVTDELRNQGIIKNTALGGAYAKWLANPQVGKELYMPMIDSLKSCDHTNAFVMGINKFTDMVLYTESPTPGRK